MEILAIDPNNDGDEILKALEVLQKHPEILNKLIDNRHKEIKRRSNWSKLSNAPYYRERFALEFKHALDELSKDWTDREYKYLDYPDMSRNTLYCRVNQSKIYLIDNLDPDDKYKKIIERLAISREKTGIRLHVLKDSEPVIPSLISEDEKHSWWQQKINDYLNSSKVGDKPLHLKDLSLTVEEVNIQKESMEQPSIEEKFIFLISAREIKIVRIAE